MKSAVIAPWPRSLMFLISASGKVFSRPTKMPTRFMNLCYPLIGQIDRHADGEPSFLPSRLFEPSYLSPGVLVKHIRALVVVQFECGTRILRVIHGRDA